MCIDAGVNCVIAQWRLVAYLRLGLDWILLRGIQEQGL